MILEELIRKAIQFGAHHKKEINLSGYDTYNETINKFLSENKVENLAIHDVSHSFNNEELNFIRQWFNNFIDGHPDNVVNKTEWEIALKIHTKLGMNPENRIVENCG